MTNPYPSRLCSIQQAVGLPAGIRGKCVVAWSSHRNNSLLNRAGSRPDGQPPAWSLQMAADCAACLLGDGKCRAA